MGKRMNEIPELKLKNERNIRDNKTGWFVNLRFQLEIGSEDQISIVTPHEHNQTSCTVYVSLSRHADFILHVLTTQMTKTYNMNWLMGWMDQQFRFFDESFAMSNYMLIYYTF